MSKISADLHDGFYAKRRTYIDEVLFDRSLKPLPRLFGLAVAQHCNRDTGDTFTDVSTIAARLGVKWSDCVKARDTLEKAGRLKITPHGAKNKTSRGRIHLELRLKHDAPHRSKCGDKAYYQQRAQWFEPVLFDAEMSPAHRLVAMCVAAFTDPGTGWCVEGHREIARVLGFHRTTVIAAMRELECRGYIRCGSAPGIETGQTLCHLSDHLSGGQDKSPEKSTVSKAIFGNSVNPKDSVGCADRRECSASPRKAKAPAPDLAAFDGLYDLIEEYTPDAIDGAVTRITELTGITNWNAENRAAHQTITIGDDICPHFDSGLLLRVDKFGQSDSEGKFFLITEAGHGARNHLRQAA